MLSSKKLVYSRGFTLIELLLVIVIIGILAGTVITLINPIQQQNRAKDANVKSALSKIALATQSFISAYGRVPKDTEFLASLSSVTSYGATCTTGGTDYDCTFSVTGDSLPNTCGTVASYAGSTSPCYFRYIGVPSVNSYFTLYAKSWGYNNGNGVFRFSNDPTLGGVIMQCDDAATPTNCVAP